MQRLWLILFLVSLPACRQDMARQPAYRPLRPSSFFADGRSARPNVPGTVAHERIKAANGLRVMTGEDWARIAGAIGTAHDNPLAAAQRMAAWSSYRETLPISIPLKTLERGQERFNI